MPTVRNLQLALVASLLLAFLGCLSASSPARMAVLECTVELRSTSGELLEDTPIELYISYPYGDSDRGPRTTSEGRIEFTERRTRDASNAFMLSAPVAQWERFGIQLPEVHPTRGYSISFVMDREHTRWSEIEQGAVLVPPLEVEPGTDPGGSTFLYQNGATYFDNTGTYYGSVVLANGTDVRRVPLEGRPRLGTEPGEPRLEVRAQATPLVGERGYELHIWLTVPNSSDRSAELSAVLEPLRAHLDQVTAGQTLNDDPERLDIEWLVGASPDELFETLGEPSGCLPTLGPGAQEVTLFSFPCDLENHDLVYRFFPPPSARRGSQDGGKDLRLSFGQNGTCKSASWEFIR